MQVETNTPGTFSVQKDAFFRLQKQQKAFDISPLKPDTIVVSNQAAIGSQSAILTPGLNIADMVLPDRYCGPAGRTRSSAMGSSAVVRTKRTGLSQSPSAIKLVSETACQRIKNRLYFLKKSRHARPGKEGQFEPSLSEKKRGAAPCHLA